MENKIYKGIHFACDLEVKLAMKFDKLCIRYIIPDRLDFYLPTYDIYVEVKKFHTDRVLEQLKSQDNIILIQGVKSVDAFIKLLTGNG